ncbi:hypothetical protein [Streptomyces sp. JH34]|uniref:hypothetical protein n=1 Tax=Streptomyces sp. JH34 TaxID=2793633 RepID=UPI0023F696D8|nr:hypothetical protein [Streptomyces sp. JH34]MDF6018390.1 hypothetical protein [Streptomyces sp. JH34]
MAFEEYAKAWFARKRGLTGSRQAATESRMRTHAYPETGSRRMRSFDSFVVERFTVIDLASRRLARWAIAGHMRADLVIDAAAIRTRGGLAGSIMRVRPSDRVGDLSKPMLPGLDSLAGGTHPSAHATEPFAQVTAAACLVHLGTPGLEVPAGLGQIRCSLSDTTCTPTQPCADIRHARPHR